MIYNETMQPVGGLRTGVEWAQTLAQGAHGYNFLSVHCGPDELAAMFCAWLSHAPRSTM